MTRNGCAPRLSMRGVAVRYGETLALDGADFAVAPGEARALLGENGAGKSSLLKALFGFAPMCGGAIEVDGEPFHPSLRAAEARGLALVHQELSLVPHLTVKDAILLGAHRSRGMFVDRRARDDAARHALQLAGRSDLPLSASVRSLTAAQRQIVEIARACSRASRLIVLDEPTSSLGADDAERLYSALDALRMRDVSVVYVSHALAEVRRVASSATVLRDGRTAFAGSLDSVTDQQLIAHMAGREVAEASASSRGVASGIALKVERLSCAPVVREASFELRNGEILGIAGLAGAGRTELLEAIFSLRATSGGSVTFAQGHARSIAGLWKSGVGMVREDRKHGGLSLRQSIACNAALPSVGRIAHRGMLSSNTLRAHADGPCRRLGVRMRSLDQPILELSGGNQQKVAFARLLAAGARVLLLDEPTRGIDVGARAAIHDLLREASAGGAAILVVSSQLPELLQLCDRIAVMRQGVLSASRPAHEWTQESLVAAALHASKGVGDIA